MADERNVGCALAKELNLQIREYFQCVLDEEFEDFIVVYWVACYLDPVQKLMMSSLQVEQVKQYLRGNNMLWYLISYIYSTEQFQLTSTLLAEEPQKLVPTLILGRAAAARVTTTPTCSLGHPPSVLSSQRVSVSRRQYRASMMP